jgi:hypothetical protein
MKFSNMKYNENIFNNFRVVTCGQADRYYDDVNRRIIANFHYELSIRLNVQLGLSLHCETVCEIWRYISTHY